jgi:hypothetical protein
MATKTCFHGRSIGCLTALLVVLASIPIDAQEKRKDEDRRSRYADLTAEWTQWLFAQPAVDVHGTNTNPAVDSTGAYADSGQKDGIGPGNQFFFLAGTFGGDAHRTVTVPRGKTLFFPVIATNADNAVSPPAPRPFTVPELRKQAADFADSITSASAMLNGHPVEVFRMRSSVFDYTLPKKHSIYTYFGLVGPQFEGRVHPSVSDGYWCVIPPLAPGFHDLEFAAASSLGFSVHVTYSLTIHK